MSSGDAGPAGDAGQAQQGEAAQGEQQQGAPDYAALLEGQQQMGQQFEQMREYLQSNPWAQQQEAQEQGEPEPEAPNLDFLGSGDPDYDQQLAQGLQNLIETQAQQQVQQHIAPLQEQLKEVRDERAAEQLTRDYPELLEPENAQGLIKMAGQAAQIIGQPELAENFEFMRYIHMAHAGARAHAEEQETSPAAHLEGAGGPGAGQQQGVDLGDLIVNGQSEGAPLGKNVLPWH